MQEYITLLRSNPNYRNLWLGSVVSQLGDWFNLIAAAGLISRLTESGLAVSSLFLARYLPLFLFSPVAGVLADRFDRRKIMIASDLLRALTVLGFLLVRSPQQVWLFYALTIVQFSLSALFSPARSAVIANVVRRDELVAANALDSLTWSTMLALGAFIGGAVAAVFGADAAFVADALTFLLSAFFIARIVLPERTRPSSGPTGGWLQFWEGLKYLRLEWFILVIALAKAGGSLFWGAINVLEITFAELVYVDQLRGVGQALGLADVGAATLGLVYVVSGLGTGLGPIFMRRWLGDAPGRLMTGITIGFALLTAGILGLSAAPTLGFFLLATLVRTVGSGTVWVFSAALLQMVVPDRYRGRVFAFEFAMLTLTQSISIFAAGVFLDSWGLDVRQVAAIAGGVGLLVTLTWGLFYAFFRGMAQTAVVDARAAADALEAAEG
jgi:MFS family permease